jgi:hypothetical protein
MGNRTRADLLRDRFGVDIGVNTDPVVAAVGVAALKVLNNNPNRLAFTLVNLGTGKVYLKPDNTVSIASGIVLTAGGGSVNLEWSTDYDLVGMEWWAIADLAATPILTIEVVAR